MNIFKVGDLVRIKPHDPLKEEHAYGTNGLMKQHLKENKVLRVEWFDKNLMQVKLEGYLGWVIHPDDLVMHRKPCIVIMDDYYDI